MSMRRATATLKTTAVVLAWAAATAAAGVATAVLIGFGVPSTAAGAARGEHRIDATLKHIPVRTVGALAIDRALFWNGRRIVSSGTPAGAGVAPNALCGTSRLRCFDYRLELAGGGIRLRVAIDHPGFDDLFSIELYDPQGRFVGVAATDATQYAVPTDARVTGGLGAALQQAPIPGGGQSAEVFVKRPAAGVWTARAVANRVVGSAFRMRAKLEGRPGAAPQPQMPDLRMTPPFQLTFRSPEGTNESCTGDERSAHRARTCLRLSVGPENVGDGVLDLRYSADGVAQRLYRSDGTYEERAAGELEYRLDLLVVSSGRMRLVGTGPRQRVCTLPHRIAQWQSFGQAPTGTAPHGCRALGHREASAVGLEAGWADVHLWSQAGNYVEFGDNPDGLYVVRARADDERKLFEERSDNNDAYAYIKVTGETIEVLERGYGASPWHAGKVLAADGLEETIGARSSP